MCCKLENHIVHISWRRIDPQEKRSPGQKVPGPRIIHSVLLVDSHGEVQARGLAFCSPKDSPNDARGYNIALGRAIKALELAETAVDPELCRPVKRREILLLRCSTEDWAGSNPDCWKYKLLYKPIEEDLDPKEQRALTTWRHRNIPQQQAATA